MRAWLLLPLLPALLGAGPVPHATLVAEPLRAGVGEIVEVEILASGGAGQRLRPFDLPEIPGFWLLSSETGPPEARGAGWLQRTHLRLRAREAGVHPWPLGELTLEDASGRVERLALPALSLEVHSLLSELPDRQEPFGLRAPPAPSRALPFGLGVACGAGGLAGILALRRRRGRAAPPGRAEGPRSRSPEASAVAEPPPSELRTTEPREAARRASRLVRDRLQQGFGVPAQSATHEELAASGPARGEPAEWKQWLALLRRLDAWRFQPVPGEKLADCLAEIRRLAEPAGPTEPRK